jgi:hypothetical protein
MALAHGAAGWSGLMVLIGLAAAATAGLITLELRRWLGALSVVVSLGLTLPLIAAHAMARPHMLALPLLALWTSRLIAARRAGRAPELWLLPVMTIWANLHGGYLLGLALICPFALEAVLDSSERRLPVGGRWGGFLLAAFLAALITPYGLGGLIHALHLVRMSSLQAIEEWAPASFARPTPLEAAILATVFVCLYKGVRMGWVRAAILLGLVYMTVQHIRHELVLAVVAPLLLAQPLGAALNPARASPVPRAVLASRRAQLGAGLAAGIAIAALGGLRLASPEPRHDSQWIPLSALANVPAAIAARPVFNDYGFGGWLIFNGVRPFIDGRNDLYGDAAVQTYLDVEAAKSPAETARIFQSRDIAWTILKPASPLAAALDKTPGWVRLYADPWAVVQVRADLLRAEEAAQVGR